MHTWRQHSAWLLLVLLTLGGVVAPTVHQVQHDAPHPQANFAPQPDRHLHSEIDHTIQADAARAISHSFNCLLCHTHLVFKPLPQATAPTPQLAAASLGVTDALFVASSYRNHSLIRGPPSVG